MDDDSTLYDYDDSLVESEYEADEKAMLQGDKPDPRRKNRALIIVCIILLFTCPFILVAVLHPSWSEIMKYEPGTKTTETGSTIHSDSDEIQAEDISIKSLVNTTELGLKTGFTILDTPTVREYEFRISYGHGSPDGFRKLMILANGQSPGPLIEANVGDTIRVLVHNEMNNSTSIHWHGLDQRGSTWMDGVMGVSQCSIPPGRSFTYEFQIIDQRGTYWWHAHTSLQYTDGLFGPIIIHDPNERVPPYSDDQILFIGDHYHAHASTVLRESYLHPGSVWSPDIPGVEPLPDNFLLNGQHVYDCSVKSTTFPSLPGNPCSGGGLSQTLTQPNTTLRLRLISHSSFTSTWFSIDNHTLTLVEIDGVEIEPITNLRGVYLNVGQRLSVLVNTSNAPGSYHMRATMPQSCFVPYCPYASSGLESIGYEGAALLSYGANGQTAFLPTLGAPGNRSNPYGIENNFLRGDVWEGCDDMPFDMPKPARRRDAVEVGDRNKHEITFRFQEVGEINRIFINRVRISCLSLSPHHVVILTVPTQTSYSPLKDDAQLWKLLDNNETDFTPGNQGSYSNWGLRLDQQVLLVPDADEGVQIAINSKDQMEHPFHAHGHSFQVVAWGPGEFEGGSNPATTWNLQNPMRRDTVTVPAQWHVVIRFMADNPGVWGIHCHIQWHAEGGMFVTMLERPNDLKGLVDAMDPATRELSQSFCKAR
jgi:FtsP/CotA-like multicopper oxidase with cupredoxin domain